MHRSINSVNNGLMLGRDIDCYLGLRHGRCMAVPVKDHPM